MEIPLEKRLKKRLHVEVGMLQDEVMEIAYSLDNSLVFHGGTAIWRCFSGSRFSEDLDLYCSHPKKIADGLKGALDARSLSLVKFKRTENLIFSKISNGQVEVRLELNIGAKISGEVRRYEKINGSGMDVLCRPAEKLILEKAAAYKNRRFVRDLYDVYYLSGIASGKEAATEIGSLLDSFKPPVDRGNLPALIYAGAVPSVEQMLSVLRGRGR